MLDFIKQPWPWYVAGPIIGLFVPLLLLIGNKSFGLSSSLQHLCKITMPINLKYFKYELKPEVWSLAFVLGILIGGFLTKSFFWHADVGISEATLSDLKAYGISDFSSYSPSQIFGLADFSLTKVFILLFGGFLVGFGTRYANGCTSGHAIFGISNLHLPSIVATCCFMAGGILSTWLVLPFLFKLLIR